MFYSFQLKVEAKCTPSRLFNSGAISYDESKVAFGIIEYFCVEKESKQRWQLWKKDANSKSILLFEQETPIMAVGWLGEKLLLKDKNLSYFLWDPFNPKEISPIALLQGKAILVRSNSVWYWGNSPLTVGLWKWEPGAASSVRIGGSIKEEGELVEYRPAFKRDEAIVGIRQKQCERLFLRTEQGEFLPLVKSCSGIPLRSQWSQDNSIFIITNTEKNGADLLTFDPKGKRIGKAASQWEPVMLSPWFLEDDPPRLGVITPRALYEVIGENKNLHAMFAFPGEVSLIILGEQRKYILLGMDPQGVSGFSGFLRMAVYDIRDNVMRDLP